MGRKQNTSDLRKVQQCRDQPDQLRRYSCRADQCTSRPQSDSGLMVAQGATYRGSSGFVDAEFQLGDDYYSNLLLIVPARNRAPTGWDCRHSTKPRKTKLSSWQELSLFQGD